MVRRSEFARTLELVFAALVLITTATLARANAPSIDQVYQAARTGHLAQAEAMTREVLQAYPDSARAHYVMAQILAAEGRAGEARGYLEAAERLKPGLPFANPQSVANLERRINGQPRPAAVPNYSTNHVHWWWLLIGAFFVYVLFRALRYRGQASRSYADSAPSAGGGSFGLGAPTAGYGGRGILGSVLAGLGFGAGAAAGERAIDHFLGREREQPSDFDVPQSSSGAGDLGGDVFGVQPGESSSGGWEDSGDQSTGANGSGDWDASGSGDGGWDDSSGGQGGTDV